ncbi:MAG TPA: FmdB family zinc ribbon protein [Candidatus Limnocylindrales bacterium]|nr:FmdB family zinc ribbon protein [Candidatus Limnocylindrales bacterium]
MPIYAYKCSACGFAKDVLRKMSDAPLAVCPSCGESAFGKQLTAAGFQLKGSGWYVTDFREGGAGKTKDREGAKEKSGADGAPSEAPAGAPAAAPAASPSSAPAPAPAPAAPTPTPAKGD